MEKQCLLTGLPSMTDPDTISLRDAVDWSNSRCSHARCSLPSTSQKGESCDRRHKQETRKPSYVFQTNGSNRMTLTEKKNKCFIRRTDNDLDHLIRGTTSSKQNLRNTQKNIYISLFSLTIIGPIYYGLPL